jgi:hypothetical protein
MPKKGQLSKKKGGQKQDKGKVKQNKKVESSEEIDLGFESDSSEGEQLSVGKKPDKKPSKSNKIQDTTKSSKQNKSGKKKKDDDDDDDIVEDLDLNVDDNSQDSQSESDSSDNSKKDKPHKLTILDISKQKVGDTNILSLFRYLLWKGRNTGNPWLVRCAGMAIRDIKGRGHSSFSRGGFRGRGRRFNGFRGNGRGYGPPRFNQGDHDFGGGNGQAGPTIRATLDGNNGTREI